jgi:hypothetical protein
LSKIGGGRNPRSLDKKPQRAFYLWEKAMLAENAMMLNAEILVELSRESLNRMNQVFCRDDVGAVKGSILELRTHDLPLWQMLVFGGQGLSIRYGAADDPCHSK